MCSHDDFDILICEDGCMIRRCKKCKAIEVKKDKPKEWKSTEVLDHLVIV